MHLFCLAFKLQIWYCTSILSEVISVAGLCLDCFNKINGLHLIEAQVIVSRNLALCEDCGTFKPVIVKFRNRINRSSVAPSSKKETDKRP